MKKMQIETNFALIKAGGSTHNSCRKYRYHTKSSSYLGWAIDYIYEIK